MIAHVWAASTELWDEVSVGLAGIGDIAVTALAMSIRTQSLVTGVREIPPIRGTILVRHSGWFVPMTLEGKTTLGELFGELRGGLAGDYSVRDYDVLGPRL